MASEKETSMILVKPVLYAAMEQAMVDIRLKALEASSATMQSLMDCKDLVVVSQFASLVANKIKLNQATSGKRWSEKHTKTTILATIERILLDFKNHVRYDPVRKRAAYVSASSSYGYPYHQEEMTDASFFIALQGALGTRRV